MNSGFELRAAERSDREELAGFLQRVFKFPPDTFFIRPEVLDWKYFQPRADSVRPRSWIVKSGGRIVAHLGALPLRIPSARGIVDSFHPIDWTSDREFAGVGALLFRTLARRAAVVLALGGTHDAQRVIPSLGFSSIGSADVYARSVRPWRQLRQAQALSLKSGAKLARSVVRSLRSRVARTGWSADPVKEFSPDTLDVVSGTGIGETAVFPEPSAAALNFALACPGGNGRGFVLSRGGQRMGYLVLTRPEGQVRITDLRIRSEQPADWAAAYSLALDLAWEDPFCNEIMSFASTDLARAALAANGFQRIGSRTVRILDREKILSDLPPLQLQSITTDAFFLTVPSRPYYLV